MQSDSQTSSPAMYVNRKKEADLKTSRTDTTVVSTNRRTHVRTGLVSKTNSLQSRPLWVFHMLQMQPSWWNYDTCHDRMHDTIEDACKHHFDEEGWFGCDNQPAVWKTCRNNQLPERSWSSIEAVCVWSIDRMPEYNNNKCRHHISTFDDLLFLSYKPTWLGGTQNDDFSSTVTSFIVVS